MFQSPSRKNPIQPPALSAGGQRVAGLPDATTANNGNKNQDFTLEILDFFHGGAGITVEMDGLAEAVSMGSMSDRNDIISPPSTVKFLPDHFDEDGREMQEVCAAGDAFSVSSTLFPEAEGCYEEFAGDPNLYATASSTRVIGLVAVTTTSSESVPMWLTGAVVGSSSGASVIEVECLSGDIVTIGSHPTDVTSWFCFIANVLAEVSGESFSADCGCSDAGLDGTPSPFNANAPTPPVAPTPVGDSGCSGTDSFSITSGTFEDFEGCYVDASVDSSSFFSQTGELAGGLEAVFASFLDENSQDPRWIAGVYAEEASSADVVTKCISSESPAVAHPADSTWFCDLTGTGAFTTPSDAQFSITCDCNSTSSSATDGASQSPAPSLPSSTASPGGATDSPSTEEREVAPNTPTPTPTSSIDPPTVNQPISAGEAGTSGAAGARGAGFGCGPTVAGTVGIICAALVGLLGLVGLLAVL